ncbi:MAG: hypothetical protein JSV43_00150 [Methanobacteriota archaeon]|nr:MAG: hypothetical protein JSV43_00150 [Euryarchaeota archaeon]
MKPLTTGILVAVAIVSLVAAGLGLVLLNEEPEEPSLKISPSTLNLGSEGNTVLFSLRGLGPTPDIFQGVGLDFGWDLLGPSAPMASFDEVGLCAEDKDTTICMLEKEEPDEATKFKVSRELVSSLAQEACDMGGCHPLDNGKSSVNVTMWGEIEPGVFFELNDMLEVIPVCPDCRVTVTLKSITYTGDDVGDDWLIRTRVAKGKSSGGTKTWLPGDKSSMELNHSETTNINTVVFDGVIGKKGDLVWIRIYAKAWEFDPLDDDESSDEWEFSVEHCPYTEEVKITLLVTDYDIFGGYLGKLELTFEVVADP